ncbi:MAG: hypothetical protein ACOC2W_01305 [bacterium]
MTEEKNERVIIVAPHPDDEIIGCYSILKNVVSSNIVYTTNIPNDRREEALKIKEYFNVRQYFVNFDLPPALMDKSNIYYFPDPINEVHPDHRRAGYIGEQMVRSGYNVIFYSINKNVPYIFEVNNIEEKEEMLNKIYPSQKSLWEYEKKYILFEGYNKWLIY